jgi:hypothetical protein
MAKTKTKAMSKGVTKGKPKAKAKKSAMSEFKGIPGWSSKMEDRYRKRLEEHVRLMTTGRYARIVRAAIVNAEFRKWLEKDPAGVLKEYGVQPKGNSIMLVAEDRGVFPIVIPKVLEPFPWPEPDPGPFPLPEPDPGPRPGPTPGPDPGRPGGIVVGPGELSSGTRAFWNDDRDIRGLRNDRGKHSDEGNDQTDIAKASDGTDPTGDPDYRD